MNKSRTENVSINVVIAIVCQIVNLLLNFVVRTFFIKILGAEYLGVNGLFTNVITILSFAELGIGSAIIFSMYKPLAIGDKNKICSLMRLYKKAYWTIGIIVAAVGIVISPFLQFIVKEQPDIPENLTVLYFLFLANTVASYFFVYKKSIIIADQKNYIVLGITEAVHLVQVIVQIILLIITRDYFLYLLLQVVFTVLSNAVSSVVADRLYPYLREDAEPLSKEESRGIFSNVKALAVYKFGSVILNGTDNILVSSLVGVLEVGLVSNYVLLTTSCNAILGKITESFTASVGNLNAVGDRKSQYDIFNKILFITAWLYGFAAVGLFVVSKYFIEAWIGTDYLLDNLTVFGIVAGFYVQGVHFAAYTYRTTLGLFRQAKLSPLFAAILNIILSIILCKCIGLAGIFIATPISRLLTNGIVDPLLIYTKIFRKNPINYYIKYFAYCALFVGIAILSYFAVAYIAVAGWVGVVIKILTVTLIFNCIMILVFFHTKTFKDILRRFVRIIKKKG